MKISIIGGGPAGLYCANALKSSNPHFDVTIYEAKNESINSFGLGYTLQKGTKGFLNKIDHAFLDSLFSNKKPPHLTRAVVGANDNFRFFDFAEGQGLARCDLMRYLRNKALELKVKIIDKKVSTASLVHLQKTSDLLIGADGVNSIVRRKYAAKFKSQEHEAKIRVSWFYNDSIEAQKDVRFYVQQTPNGAVQLCSYPITETRQAVIIEMTEKCFKEGGFDERSAEQSRNYLSDLFSTDHDRISLIPTQLSWFPFKMNSTKSMYYKNVVLVGEAAFSFHYSAGVGLNAAFSMGYTLNKCLNINQDINSALHHYTKASMMALRPSINKSREDISWLESIDTHLKHTNGCDLIDHYLQKNKYQQQTAYQ